MHHQFIEALKSAEGESKFVIALNLDVRGFSDWSLDPAQSALYLKKLYSHLYEKYFSDASMVKPTGDGLMVVLVVEEETLEEVATKTVTDAVEIVENFNSMTRDARLINFDVPEQVGIGIARGSASRLVSDDLTLDYSGLALNLASRLMDLARPYGLVIDDGFGMDLLPEDLVGSFKEETVYLKGVSPRDPMLIHCWPDEVTIPPSNKHPLDEPQWEHATHECTLGVLGDLGGLTLELPSRPPEESALDCQIRYDEILPDGGPSPDYYAFQAVSASVIDLEGMPHVWIKTDAVVRSLRAKGVGDDWMLRIRASYQTE